MAPTDVCLELARAAVALERTNPTRREALLDALYAVRRLDWQPTPIVRREYPPSLRPLYVSGGGPRR